MSFIVTQTSFDQRLFNLFVITFASHSLSNFNSMKINDKEIYEFSIGSGDKTGRISHKVYSNYKESSNKERWIKLKGNLLYFYKLNEYGGLDNMIPNRFWTLELFKVKHEYNESLPFAFSLVFEAEPEKRHIFSCCTQTLCDEWVQLLKDASYQSTKVKIQNLRKYIISKTGKDPYLTLSNLSDSLMS